MVCTHPKNERTMDTKNPHDSIVEAGKCESPNHQFLVSMFVGFL